METRLQRKTNYRGIDHAVLLLVEHDTNRLASQPASVGVYVDRFAAAFQFYAKWLEWEGLAIYFIVSTSINYQQ